MILSHRTSIITSAICILAWVGLFALFYWGPHEYGAYPAIDFGSVRGESVERFTLSPADVVLASERATGDFSSDTLLVASRPETGEITVYVVRDQNLIYEKSFEKGRFDVVWDQTLGRFKLTDASEGQAFLLIPGEHTYILEIAP